MEKSIEDEIVAAFLPLLKAIVDAPEAVEIKVHKSEFTTLFVYIKAPKSEIGKIIGREGRHASAFRVLLSALGSKYKYRTIVEINSPEDRNVTS